MTTVEFVSRHRALKTYRCSVCGASIQPGSSYWISSSLTSRLCAMCFVLHVDPATVQ